MGAIRDIKSKIRFHKRDNTYRLTLAFLAASGRSLDERPDNKVSVREESQRVMFRSIGCDSATVVKWTRPRLPC